MSMDDAKRDEAKRLATLEALSILDTPASVEMDRITNLASAIFGTPISLLTLVDAKRQWFKSRQGLDVAETPREHAFCHHAIQSDDIMEVTDAVLDPRFRDNPLVTASPEIRYYCGMPLVARNGARLGTLCVIDTRPREAMSLGKRLLLKELAAQAIREIELHRLGVDTGAVRDLLP